MKTIIRYFQYSATSHAKKLQIHSTNSEYVRLGKSSNNLKIGIVGLPNIGKSSLFNILTKCNVPTENFPFNTIEPSESKTSVPDSRFDFLCQLYNPKSRVPAVFTIIDIAGLVKGANEGQGLGNAFLSNIRTVDGIFHLIRGFEDDLVEHVEVFIDPIRDVSIIHEELRLKDVSTLEKIKTNLNWDKKIDPKKELIKILHQKVYDFVVVEKKAVKNGHWTLEEAEYINSLHLLTAKSVIYLCNVSITDYCTKDATQIKFLQDHISKYDKDITIIPYSNVLETNLSKMNVQESTKYLESLKMQYRVDYPILSAIPSIIQTGFSSLNLIQYFTVGKDEVKSWVLNKGLKAPQAAGVIHSDFEKTFIMAEVMKIDDLLHYKTDAAVKAAGKCMQKGRDYVVEDGDVISIY